MNKTLLASVAGGFLFLTTSALAGEALNADSEGLAIRGYDPVAYFTMGKPVEGSPEHEHEWRETRWRFATEDHREMFAADPQRYAPRYGGYCAGAMWRGVKAPIDPEAFAIIDDRLYLAYADWSIEAFKQNAEVSIPEADRHWTRIGSE